MERDTPYRGDRYPIGWMCFYMHGSQTLKIDVCAGDVVRDRLVTTRDLFVMQSGDRDRAINVYTPEYIFAEKLEPQPASRLATDASKTSSVCGR